MIGRPRDLRTLTAMLKAAASEGAEMVDAPVAEAAEKGKAGDRRGAAREGSSLRRKAGKVAATAFLSAASKIPIPAGGAALLSVGSTGGPTDASGQAGPVASSTLSDLELLKESLHAAIALEFATVPPYLTALWSIIDQTHPVAKVIRAIAHEEMLHVALLCNLLAAIGERPVLTGDVVPRYPSRLPGSVHKELEISLRGYGGEALSAFLEIERPEDPLPIEGESVEDFPVEDTTIGEFYTSLLALFDKVQPPLDSRHQIAGPFVWFVMTEPDHVREAIKLIMAQGEGARGQPYSHNPHYLSHYYRFKSLAMSVELIWDDATKIVKKGKPIEQPSVFTLAPASSGGYGLAVPRELREANERFEGSYSRMLRLLEETWKDGGHKSFVQALEYMFELTQLAQAIMRIGTPDGRGYCPAFLYRP